MTEQTWRWVEWFPGVWVPAQVVEAEAEAEVERWVVDAAELPY